MSELDLQPLFLRPEQAGVLLGVGRSKIYEMMAAGRLPSLHIGTRRLIERRAVEIFIQQMRDEREPVEA